MGNLCIIPARGGSKRIPRKNLKPFLGVPIIAYSIKAAQASGLFSEIMVSTDDDEIAAVALQYGASVPFMRSAATATDYATTTDVLAEVLAAYAAQGRTFEYVCCIYATAPLINADALKKGFSLLRANGFDTVYPVVQFAFPIWRGVTLNQGRAQWLWPEHAQTRSQDLPTTYHDAGQWYWFVPSRLGNALITNNTGALVLSEAEVQDIDNETDWLMAELKYERLHRTA